MWRLRLSSLVWVVDIVNAISQSGLYAYTVNFKMAVTLCKEFLNDPDMTGGAVMQEIGRNAIPIRPGRVLL